MRRLVVAILTAALVTPIFGGASPGLTSTVKVNYRGTKQPAHATPKPTSYPPAADAKFLTGSALAELWRAHVRCARESQDCVNASLYTPYIYGAYDGFPGHRAMRISAGQLESIVGRYLEAHPYEWQENAALLVGKALHLGGKAENSSGSFKSGSDLIELFHQAQECRENPKGNGCTADLLADAKQYPRGIHDALLVQGLLPNCEKQNCDAGGIEKAVTKYLKDNPQKAKLNGMQVILESLQDAFPLPKR
jgi:hypothetical protein